MVDETPGAKYALQKLPADEWARIRNAAPEIDDVLRRACNIVGSQPIFDSAGKPAPLLAVRLQNLKWQGIRAILDVIGEPLAPAHVAAAGHADEVAADGVDGPQSTATTTAELTDRLESVQRLVAALRGQQGQVLAALTRVRSRVERGMAGAGDDLTEVTGWQAQLVQAAALVALAPEDVSLSRLDEAAAQASADLRAAADEFTLAVLIAGIASLKADGERAALSDAVDWAAALDTAAVADNEKSLLLALDRVMTATTSAAVDAGDAGLVMTAFGMSALLASVGALASRQGTLAGHAAAPSPAHAEATSGPDGLASASPARAPGQDAAADKGTAASAADHAAAAAAAAADDAAAAAAAEPTSSGTGGDEADAVRRPRQHPAAIPTPVPDAPAADFFPEHDQTSRPATVVAADATPQDERHPEQELVRQQVTAEAPPDPRLTTAVHDGQTGLAYWYSVALQLPAAVQDAFEVLALSEAVTADGDDASGRIREILSGYQVDGLGQSAEYAMVLAAGSARALLRMPFSPCAEILLGSVDRLTPGRDRDFLHAVWEAGTFGFDLTRLSDVHARSIDDFITRRDDALKNLRAALDTARHATTKYSPASDVLRRIMNDREPLGGAVSAVLAAPEELGPAEQLLGQLRDQKAIDRLIDDTHQRQNPVSARKAKIVSGARDQIRSRAAEVLEALRQYLEAARTLQSRRQACGSDLPTLETAVRNLNEAAKATDDDAAPTHGGPGSCAATHVRSWACDALTRRPEALAVHPSPIETDLARAFEVTRAEDGTVDTGSVTLPLLDAIAGRSAEVAYEGFAAADDFAGIDRLIDTLHAAGDDGTADRLTGRQADDVKISRERLRKLAEKAERELALALFAALLSESESADLGVVLARYRNPDVDDFLVARRQLDGIVEQVAAARARGIDEARAQLSSLESTDEVRTRITGQLDRGDLVTAQEFLAQLKAGSYGLPAEAATDETFGTFWPTFIQEATVISTQGEVADGDWIGKLTARQGAIAGRPLLPPHAAPAVELGLTGWRELTSKKRVGGWERWLKDVLYLLGFEVRGPFPNSPSRSGQWATKFTAKLVGRSLVPTYGSSADGHYQVLLSWGKQTPERILEMVEELPHQAPVVVLAFSTLSMRDRRTLAERARGKGTSAVIIDHAVMAFLATGETARLQTTLGLTLPFTAINPYTPFVLGDVPREVFYGRREELRDVQDANGPLFVYGGRQLGKSTLLKTAMREFAETDENWRSVYIDLKAEGIGELRVPDDLWSVLIPRLQQAEIVDAKVSAKASPDVVVTAVRNWLDADPRRRFLLLLDEADAFLETDARPRPGQAGESRFVNVYRLKNLMDGSSRRFKPVFAGLHQVQRFHSVSNGPMAHVGAEILIGPLPPSEAYKLVVEPLAAIGYRFERADIAWRLLAYTNYQASLVQAFCNALVRRMHDRRLSSGAPPTVITDRDIEEVYGDREVRDWIASRFELTINLDNRYRVIAYATAMMTNDTDRPVFAVSTLLDACKTFWAAGFHRLNLDAFTAYLDEMVGLGVLVRTTGDEYGIRSPNVIRLLGSPNEIERRLMESEDVLEVSSLFDPAVFRRKISDDPDRRSPLTEQQVQQILEGRRQLHVIVGSAALGLDRVIDALTVAAPGDIEVRTVSCHSVNAAITALSRLRSGRQHIVLDLADGSETEQRSAMRHLSAFATGNDRRTASCLAAPSIDWLWADDLDGIEFQPVRLQLWTQDTLRAWAPECQYPLSTADQRRRLLDDTGGWPFLVERAARAARAGATDQRARDEALGLLDNATAGFLASVGIPSDPVTGGVVRALADWGDEIGFEGLATLVTADPDDLLAALRRLMNLGVVSNGSSLDAYRANPLIARLLRDQR
jgi:hypothetical protein